MTVKNCHHHESLQNTSNKSGSNKYVDNVLYVCFKTYETFSEKRYILDYSLKSQIK